MAIWNRLTAAISGFGIGGAASAAAAPVFEVPKQKAWASEPNRILGLGDLATLVATGLMARSAALDEAKRNGYAASRLDARIQLALTVPSIGELDAMLNRGIITDDQFDHALAKHGLEAQYWPAVRDLLNEKLSPGELAAAIHRGLVPDPGLLKGEQPQPPFNVEAYPVYPIPTLAEAAASGYDKERLGVLVGLQGLPMGPHEAAQALFRGIITHGDYIRAFNESNNRNEWADAVLQQTRQIPTARDFFENALRGYHDLAWAQEQAKRHGMSDADALVIYQNQGRPMNIRSAQQALARGATFHPEPGELTDPFDAIVVEGNLKPAYYEMAKSLRYTLPSPFVMRSLAQSGTWSEEKTAERLKWAGWYPQDADEAAKAWANPSGGSEDPWVKRAETQFWTTTHASYKANETDGTEARNNLAQLGITGENANRIVQLWEYERDTIRKQLTPAQLVKAFKKAAENPATAQPYTRQDVIDRLIGMGYLYNDAVTLLDESL